MHQRLPLKKLVVELRYKADLGFYSKMDATAMGFKDQFPDWERSPLTVEIRNKKQHRRLFLSHQRCFYEADGANADTELDHAEKILRNACRELSVSQLSRIGVRQWFAADLERPFARLVEELTRRFLNQDRNVCSILSDRPIDMAYVVDYESSGGWKYHLRLGPMTKTEWFQSVTHDAHIFDEPDKESDGATFKEFQAGFPEQLLYLDVDCYCEDRAADQLNSFLADARRKSHDIAARLITYCKE